MSILKVHDVRSLLSIHSRPLSEPTSTRSPEQATALRSEPAVLKPGGVEGGMVTSIRRASALGCGALSSSFAPNAVVATWGGVDLGVSNGEDSPTDSAWILLNL